MQFKTILQRKLPKFMFIFFRLILKREICIMRVGPRSWARVNGLVTRAGSIYSRTTRGPINRQSVLAYSYKRRGDEKQKSKIRNLIGVCFLFSILTTHFLENCFFRQMKSSKSQLLLVSRLYVTPIQVSKGFNIKMK